MPYWMARILLSSLVILSLAGCAEQPPPQPAQVVQRQLPTPTSDKSVVTGQVVSNSNQAPIKQTYVYLAKVYWNNEHTEAAFALDIGNSPVAKTDQNGFFSHALVEPFEYVVVVGDYYGSNEAVRESNGDARVFKAEAGKVLDIGVVQVNPAVQAP